MGFSTFGSKPHLAKKRKRDGPPDAERRGSNSLLPGAQREGGVGVAVAAAAAVDTHLSENDADGGGEDGDGEFMEAGENDAEQGHHRSNGDEDGRKEAGDKHMVIGVSESAQTSSLGTERLLRLSERKTLPVSPTVISGASATKITTMTESGSDYSFAALRHGVRNQNGDVAYYDHSFVEDPWKEWR